MPREYVPKKFGYIYTNALKKAIDTMEILLAVDVPKMHAMCQNEKHRANVNDLHQQLLTVMNHLLTMKQSNREEEPTE